MTGIAKTIFESERNYRSLEPPRFYSVSGRKDVVRMQVVRMFELFERTRRKRAVARLLTEAGYRSRKGAKFEPRGIRRMISDPVYRGLKRANYSQNRPGNYVKPESEWIYVEAPAIVSEDLWDRCNAILASQKPETKRAAKPTSHLFSGLVLCHCGTKMYVRTKGRAYVCLSCKNAVGRDELEEVFIEQLKGIVFSPEAIAERLEQADQALASKQRLLATAEAERDKVTGEMNKLYRLYTEDNISGRLFAERNSPLEERLRQLQDEIPALSAEADFLRLQIRSSDKLIADARDLYTRWPGLDFATRRAVVENVTDRIVVEKDELTIELAYLPSSPDPPSRGSANSGQTVAGTQHRTRLGQDAG